MTSTAVQPTEQATTNRWMADMFLLTTATIWGINIPIVRFAMEAVDSWVFNAIRLILATIALAICVWIESRFVPKSTKKVNWKLVLLFSLVTGVLYQILFVLGVTRTTAGNTALLLSSMPMWTAILSYLFINERLRRLTWIGLGITFIGTVIVITQSGKVSLSSSDMIGSLFMLCAAIIWAGGTILSRPILQTLSPLRLALFSSLVTTPIHIGIALPRFASSMTAMSDWPILLSVFYSGVLSTGLAYASWHVGVRQLGGSHAAVYQNLVTLVAVFGGWLLLNERPVAAQIVGGALIIAGLLVMRRARK